MGAHTCPMNTTAFQRVFKRSPGGVVLSLGLLGLGWAPWFFIDPSQLLQLVMAGVCSTGVMAIAMWLGSMTGRLDAMAEQLETTPEERAYKRRNALTKLVKPAARIETQRQL